MAEKKPYRGGNQIVVEGSREAWMKTVKKRHGQATNTLLTFATTKLNR